jgi:GT2 family glycosyltransferase
MPDHPSSPPAPVTVIIVVYNGGRHVIRCLESLAAQTLLPERILILDNASADGSAAACGRLVAEDPRLADRTELVTLDRNIGFAAANNRGIAMATTEFVALLNPDAFPEPGWLESLLAAAARHPDVAAFGSRQMLAGHEGVVDGLGDCYHIGGLAWRKGHGRPLRPDDLREQEIFSACAAAAVYRRAAVLEIGGFDDDFFCYFEDVDLGLRLRLAGHRALYVPGAVVHHVGGASSGGSHGATATYFGHRNLVWTAVKDLPAPLLALSLLAHFPQTIISFCVCSGRGQAGAFVRGKWHALQGLGHCLRKRAVVQRSRKVSAWSIWKSFNRMP